MGRQDPPYLVVGNLNKPHGTKGELFVWPLTDRPERLFIPGAEFRLGDESGNRPDPTQPSLRIETVRPFRKGYLVHFAGVPTRSVAETFRDRYLLVPFSQAEPLDDGEFHYHQLLGCAVVTADGVEIGVVGEVYPVKPHDLLDVRTETGSVLVPFRKGVVTSVDTKAGKIEIDPPEGLLDS